MKVRVQEKELKKAFPVIVSIGYCNAEYLLHFEEPDFYTCGTYGWKADHYKIKGVLISTGYVPLGKIKNWELVKEYNQKAKNVILNMNCTKEEQKLFVNELLTEFIEKITK